MIFSYSTISSSKSIFGMVRIPFAKLQIVLPLLNIWDWLADWMDCCWTSALLVGWVAAALLCTVYFSSYLALVSVLSPWVCFACRWLCSFLACRWLCSSACCWLCYSRFFSSSLQIFVFFSLSSYSFCVTSFLSPLNPRLWFCR